ncbi:hypothetical protein OTU49_005082, partial [Cherax quadricarinatus]
CLYKVPTKMKKFTLFVCAILVLCGLSLIVRHVYRQILRSQKLEKETLEKSIIAYGIYDFNLLTDNNKDDVVECSTWIVEIPVAGLVYESWCLEKQLEVLRRRMQHLNHIRILITTKITHLLITGFILTMVYAIYQAVKVILTARTQLSSPVFPLERQALIALGPPPFLPLGPPPLFALELSPPTKYQINFHKILSELLALTPLKTLPLALPLSKTLPLALPPPKPLSLALPPPKTLPLSILPSKSLSLALPPPKTLPLALPPPITLPLALPPSVILPLALPPSETLPAALPTPETLSLALPPPPQHQTIANQAYHTPQNNLLDKAKQNRLEKMILKKECFQKNKESWKRKKKEQQYPRRTWMPSKSINRIREQKQVNRKQRK